MSAPLTPEQRETLENLVTFLRRGFYPQGAEPSDRDEQEIAALRAALSQPARTCGTCHHGERLVMKPGAKQRIWCHVHERHQPEDDGCLKHWLARETETPT